MEGGVRRWDRGGSEAADRGRDQETKLLRCTYTAWDLSHCRRRRSRFVIVRLVLRFEILCVQLLWTGFQFLFPVDFTQIMDCFVVYDWHLIYLY